MKIITMSTELVSLSVLILHDSYIFDNLDHFGIESKLCTESSSLSLDLKIFLSAFNPVNYPHDGLLRAGFESGQ